MGVENALKTTPTGNNSKKSFQVGFSFIYFNKKKEKLYDRSKRARWKD
jgi:hypothetical protein